MMIASRRNIPGNSMLPIEDVRWSEDVDRRSSRFLSRYFKVLLSKILFSYPFKSLVIFAFVYANSVGAHGSPIQASEDAQKNENPQRLSRRGEFRYNRLRIIIPAVTFGACLLVFFVIYLKSRKYTQPYVHATASPGAQERLDASLAQLRNVSNPNNWSHSQNPAGMAGRTRQAQRENSTHSLPAYAKEPSESERVILHETLPTQRRLNDVDNGYVGTSGLFEQFHHSSNSIPANPVESHDTADNSSSSNSSVNSHRSLGSDTDTKGGTVDTHHNSATSGSHHGEAPPSYADAGDSGGD